MTGNEKDFTGEDLIEAWQKTREKFLEIAEKNCSSDINFILKELLKDDIIVPKKKSMEDYWKEKNVD